MTSTSALKPHSLAATLVLLTAVVATALLLPPGARSGGQSITACDGTAPAPPPTNCVPVTTVPATSGVYFTVSSGGGNRDFASVAVNCDNGYATVLTVDVPAKGTGSSRVIYPAAGKCTADLEKQMSIGRARVLASVSFTVI